MKKRIVAYIRQNWILLLILFCGFVLRIIGLNVRSIWYDEACSVSFFQNPWAEVFCHRYMLRPFYFIILKLWTSLFGYKEVALRMPSVVFGVCSIFAIYFLSKKLFDKNTGIFSAFLLSISGYHIIRSQDARGYTLLMLLVLLSTNIFWNIIKNKKKSYFSYSIIMILMFLTNFFAAFLIFFVHNLFFLLDKKKYKRWLLAQFLILTISASVILPSLKYYYLEQYNDKTEKHEYENLITNMVEDFSYARKINQGGIGNYGISNVSFVRKANYYVILSLLLYALVSYFIKNRGVKKLVSKRLIFILLWFFVPVTLCLIANLFIPIAKWSKSAIIMLPAFYILISVILIGLSKKLLIVYVVSYTFFSIFSLNSIFLPFESSGWRQIANRVNEKIGENEMILFAPAHLIRPFWYYYKYEDKFSLRRIGDVDCGQFYLNSGKWQMEFNDNANLIKGLGFEEIDKMAHNVESFVDNHKGVWLVVSPWIGEKNMEILMDSFCKYYEIEWSRNFPWQSVQLYHLIDKK